ncbi:MAG: DUF2764 family protein [Phycisphaerae bacterium]|nr:DUF2764 family protein [Phycisphaerae bacterium]
MSGNNYYLLAALPGLGQLGDPLPITMGELIGKSEESSGCAEMLCALFLSDDLLVRQGFLSGEIETPQPIVLTELQVRNEAPLPEYLGIVDEKDATNPDHLWGSYYRYIFELAERYSSQFLSEWVQYEVALRNALAEARAKSLGLDPHNYLVATELADNFVDFTRLVNEWSGAADPLSGLRVLDQARYKWLVENDDWFSFSDDEIIAYGAKLLLMQRWQRLAENKES